MSRNPSKPEKFPTQVTFARMTLLGILGLFLMGFVLKLQFDYFHQVSLVRFLFLMVIHLTLVIVLEEALVDCSIASKTRFRLAFMVSLGMAIAGLLLALIEILAGTSGWDSHRLWIICPLYLVAGFGAAFGGALLATNLYTPLWEDNLPPTPELCQEVSKRHQHLKLVPQRLPSRAFDILLSTLGVVISSPVWILCLFLIWFEDPGPLFFIKNSVGRGGVNFRQLKLRTMVHNAESGTGPVLSPKSDQRVLKSGRFFRKTALDELPQLINIMKREMSFVGPRPQRTVLVNEYLKSMPEYASRHRVLPGLAGLAQVAGGYFLTPRQKLRFDDLYIKHQSLGFDIKLLCLAFLIAFWFRWQKGWDGRLPRRLLHPTG